MMGDYSMRFWFHYYIVFAVFIVVGFHILNLIYLEQPEPYIDEIFHINQSLQFCKYNFEWNEKISTPPGLYIITVILTKFYSFFYSLESCSVFGLRTFNFIISCMTFHLSFLILEFVNPHEKVTDKWKNLLSALNVVIFPILYFYSFLYYTDNLSLYLVLLMYYFYLNEQHALSDICGVYSVFVRQTNVAWVFGLVVAKGRILFNNAPLKMPLYIQRNNFFKLKDIFHQMTDESTINVVLLIIRTSSSFITTCFLLLLFIAWNNSLAFGDKSAHTLVFHTSQFLYYYIFVLFLNWPYFIPMIRNFFPSKISDIFRVIFQFCIVFFIIKFGTHVHIYLISDNRHYMFYIWKNFLQYPLVRYSLIPFQNFSLYCIMKYTSHIDEPYKCGYMIALILCLIPHKLLDFRYFIIPYVLQRLHMQRGSWWQLILETLNSILINFIVIYMFLYMPFYWPDGQKQRFSW